MECSNEQIAALLSDFQSGHLESADQEMVKAHLRTCPVCRESLNTMSLFSLYGETGQQSHPSKDVLAVYFEDPSRLDPLIAALVKEHVEHCPECAAELSILEEMEIELRSSVAGGRSEQASGGWMGRVVRYVAYAAAASLLLFFGYRVMVTGDQPGPSDVVVQLTETSRSQASTPQVSRTKVTKTLMFAIRYYHALDEYEYSAHVIDRESRHVAADGIEIQFSETGVLHVPVPSRDLADGEYQLVLRESRRADPAAFTETFYPFRLKSVD